MREKRFRRKRRGHGTSLIGLDRGGAKEEKNLESDFPWRSFLLSTGDGIKTALSGEKKPFLPNKKSRRFLKKFGTPKIGVQLGIGEEDNSRD